MVRAMSKVVVPWLGAAVAATCFAAHFVWPPAAALAVVGVIFANMHLLFVGVNVPATRAALYVAALFYAAGVARASGAPLLGVSILVATLTLAPTERLVRAFGYKSSVVMPVALAGATGILALALPIGGWVWAVVPALAWCAFVSFGMSMANRDLRKQARKGWSVKVGQEVPDFTLRDRKGEPEFQLAKQRGKYVLITLIRGDWCPLCQVKMRIYQKDAATLAKQNVVLAVISPSTGEEAIHFAKTAGLDIQLLADPENKVATLFDAVYPKGNNGQDGPIPCSFLVGPDGRLVHASRPDDVESFLDPKQIYRFLGAPVPA
jgi:peroxiredoxin